MNALSDTGSMQLANIGEGHATAMLTMPSEEFASLHLQPLQDDTWIRHAEIVRVDNLVENQEGERIKREILRDYAGEKARQGTTRRDPILEGMMYQEQFMTAYRKESHTEDADKARSYRRQLMEDHRRARAIKNAEA
ncbi:Paraflagellar Rod Proteome Component 9 [Novymonas esmeraldas]|uniref:Paraflagellar Rod Proteome Component 9 n=1 Tax=Novymonas esmeraldas TaxID=1808958 RepID=A0AAW0F2E5_9TRYP